MRVSIIGTGYVGLTTGVCLAYLGHDVICLDTNAEKIEMLRSLRSPIYEPGLDELLALASPRLSFTTEADDAIRDSDIVFIAVGTPPLPNGSPDLQYVQAAAQAVGRNLNGKFTVVVNKSTVPIGSANWVGAIVREAFEQTKGQRGEGNFGVASNPEFLREGSALHDSLYPDRVVVGSDDPRTLETMYTLYRPLLEQTFAAPSFLPRPDTMGAVPLISTDLASAELVKYAANGFLALKISFINEVGQLAERVGADITQVAKGIGLDTRIGTRFLQAGLGWGGSCFGKDTAALVSTGHEYGLSMPIVEAARQVNVRQRVIVVEKLLSELKILKGRTIGLLGLAFKPNTDDLRDAPAIEIAQRLIERGARVRVHDPVAAERCQREHAGLAISYCEQAEHLAQDADALVLVTDWSQYQDLPWESMLSRMRMPVLIDGRNFLDRHRMQQLGYRYHGIGI